MHAHEITSVAEKKKKINTQKKEASKTKLPHVADVRYYCLTVVRFVLSIDGNDKFQRSLVLFFSFCSVSLKTREEKKRKLRR